MAGSGDAVKAWVFSVHRAIAQPAIAKTSYLPAKLLEETAPQMKKKGRLQVGMDADVTVFDPATIQDRATYKQPNQMSVGVKYLLVNGTLVIRNGELDTKAFPGQPVRRAVSH
jgi:N-acyl-D-glutamate deacylase